MFKLNLIFVLLFAAICVAILVPSTPSSAYLGPGIAIGVVYAVIAIVVAIFAAIAGILSIPIIRFFNKKNKKNKKRK